MLNLLEIQTLTELETLQEDWNRLLAKTPDADYFQTFDWLRVYWNQCGTDQKLRVIVLLEGEEIVGIVPLVVRIETTRIGSVRVLTYPLDDWGSFYGPIGPDRSKLLSAALNYLNETERDWDVIDLRWVNAGDNQDEWLKQAMESAGIKAYQRPRTVIPIAQLHEGWDTYWATRSKSTRSNLQRYERKVEKLGEVEHIRFRPTVSLGDNLDPRWDLYDACTQLASVSWQGSSTTGTTLSHSDIANYLRKQHEGAVLAGGVDINLLRINGQDVAFQYNYYSHGRVSNLRHGFDPTMSKQGVGKVLMLKVLRDSCERGDKVYDFLPRHVEAKRRFCTDVLDCHSYFYSPPRLNRTLPLLGKRIFDDWQTRRLATIES